MGKCEFDQMKSAIESNLVFFVFEINYKSVLIWHEPVMHERSCMKGLYICSNSSIFKLNYLHLISLSDSTLT